MSDPADVAQPGTPVTAAERSAVDAVLRHGTIKAAARSLGKSPRTVEAQLATARERLGVATTIEVVRALFVERV